MKMFTKIIKLATDAGRVTYLNITDEIKKIIEESGIENGHVIVQSPHTTCSVIFEEFVHDRDITGNDFLQTDLNNILERIVPRELTNNFNYKYPGPEHLAFVKEYTENDVDKANPLTVEEAFKTLLNGDAHIRGSLFGCSETFILCDGVMAIGLVGSIYFIDWDQNRERNRKCYVQVVGE